MTKDSRAAGVSERTLKRAKRELGVGSEKEGDGSWSWVLPEGEAQGGQAPTVGTLAKGANVELFESAYLKEESQGGQEGQADYERGCIHGYSDGAGCYLCDPNHPYLPGRAERGNDKKVTQHGDTP